MNSAGNRPHNDFKEKCLLYFHYTLTVFSGFKLFFQYLYEIFVPRPFKSVKDQLALITGGANGIGREIALNLAKHGCNIAVVDIDMKNAEKTVIDLRKIGVKAEAFKTDISSLDEIESLKVQINAKLGPVDILVNNAGVFLVRDIIKESPENLMRMIHINLMSHFWTNRVFLEDMIERKRGHIVATASASGLLGTPESVTYSATKFAVRGFMESLSLELHHRGHGDYIKTTCIFPYFVRTCSEVVNSVNEGCKYKVLYTVADTGKTIVDGILRNEDIITIPRIFYFIFYLTNLPMGIKRLLVDKMAVKNFRGLAPKNI